MNGSPDKETPRPEIKAERRPYEAPRLTRWGTLRELTLGGRGKRGEPSKRLTRF